MKYLHFAFVAFFAPLVLSGCPFAELKRSGLLSEEDIEKFETVKRDPKAAEALFQAHQANKRAAAPEPASGGLIGPIVNGALDLPYGGGLRMTLSIRIQSTKCIDIIHSEPFTAATHRKACGNRYTNTPATRPQTDPWQ